MQSQRESRCWLLAVYTLWKPQQTKHGQTATGALHTTSDIPGGWGGVGSEGDAQPLLCDQLSPMGRIKSFICGPFIIHLRLQRDMMVVCRKQRKWNIPCASHLHGKLAGVKGMSANK